MEQFNHTLMAYLRHVHKEQFANIPLIGRPLDLAFEKVCMKAYLELMVYDSSQHLENQTTLEQDLTLLNNMTLSTGSSYNLRFATIYRSE